jgi:threonine/homoserine/homoserine lactone efflux protein
MDNRGMWQPLLAYVGLCLLISLAPGLDTAVVTRSVLGRGPRAGVWTALGCALGLFAHAAAVAAGLAVLLARSAVAFEAVRLAGAALLVFLGIRSLLASRHASSQAPDPVETAPRAGAPLLQGLLTNLTNPKASLFFLATLPQFLPADRPQAALPIAIGLATIAAGFSATFLSAYAMGLGRVRSRLLGPRFRRLQERLLGAALIGLGLRVALET